MKTASVAVVTLTAREELEVLLTRVPGTVWTLPGATAPAEPPIGETARRVLADQTGVSSATVEQLYTFDGPDPNQVTVAYLTLVPPQRHALTPGGDVVELRWFNIPDLPPLDTPLDAILGAGVERLRAKASYSGAPFAMLPDAFTLSQAQKVFECSLGEELDPRNFRRDVVASGAVEPAGRTRASGPGRPAQLFRRGDGEFAVDARERRAVRRLSRQQDASDERP